MIQTIRDILKRYGGPAVDQGEDDEHAVLMATITLLMEVARADFAVNPEEWQTVRRIIETHYGASRELSDKILAAARREAEAATSLHPFTRRINRECSLEDKLAIIRQLWQVSGSDGKIDAHEEHLIRKVAGLLHVPHREYIRAKLQTVKAHG